MRQQRKRSAFDGGGWIARAAPLLIVVACLCAYANSFTVPFLFDDVQTIKYDTRIRSLWPPWSLFVYPSDVDHGTVGRPVAALTLAVNYALGGFEVAGYHAFNLAVHALAACCLYGIVRRTLLLERFGARFERSAALLALSIALVWCVHPLATKSVTYVIQRLESLMALCYLATLYCVLRGSQAREPRRWYALAVIVCALGMGVKEVMVSAPLVVLLYDRLFLAGSWRAVRQQRARLHLALAATWIVLAVLVTTSPRMRVANLAMQLDVFDYLKIQSWALVRYLRLSIWPSDLVFDYGIARTGVPLRDALAEWLPWTIALGALGAATLAGIWKGRAWSFFGACFFLILAPTSSIVPIPFDVVAEHRMYLPLAAVVAALVLGAWSALDRVWAQRSPPIGPVIGTALAACCVLALGWRTHVRNRDYASELAIWGDTVAKRPGSERAHTSYGMALDAAGDLEGAIEHYRAAVRINPDFFQAHHNLGRVLSMRGRQDEALASYRTAARLNPDWTQARVASIELLEHSDRPDETIAECREAIRAKPSWIWPRVKLAKLLQDRGQLDEALALYDSALALDPANASVTNETGILLATQGKLDQAAARFQRALALRPDYPTARNNLERVNAQRAGARKAGSQ